MSRHNRPSVRLYPRNAKRSIIVDRDDNILEGANKVKIKYACLNSSKFYLNAAYNYFY